MNFRKPFAALVVLATFTTVAPAEATLLSGTISGIVSSAGSGVPGVTVGSLVSGSYTYDTSASYSSALGPAEPLTAFSLSIGTNSQVFTLGDLETGGPSTPGVVPGNSTALANELFFFFTTAAVTSFTGSGNLMQQSITNRPPEVYSIVSDPEHSLIFGFTASPGTAIAVVPEPETVSLVGLGCVAAIAGLRRRGRGRPRG